MALRQATGALLVSGLILCAARPAAGFGVGLSVGSGLIAKSDIQRIPLNIEVTPFYKLAILYADLGFLFPADSPRDLILRPGARIDLKILYLRGAVPIQVTGTTDVGFLIGVGTLFSLGPVGLFVEANGTFSKERGRNVPIEFRGGLQLGF
jgi:hypothetical protein